MNLTNSNYWDRWLHNQDFSINRYIIRRIKKKLGNLKNKEILEIGPGRGEDILFLGKNRAKISAMDFSKEVIKNLRKNAKKDNLKINLYSENCENIKIKKVFDLVYSQGLLEHFTNPSDVLGEQKKLIKKGLILVDIPNKYGSYVRYHRLKSWVFSIIKGKKIDFLAGQTDPTYFDVKKWAEKNNLKIDSSYGRDVLYFGRFYRNKFLICLNEKLNDIVNFFGFGKYICCSIGIFLKKSHIHKSEV